MKAIEGNEQRQQSFWTAVSVSSKIKIDARDDTYLNTHGHGVSYLHFRVENRTDYYTAAPKLRTKADSKAVYRKYFE